MDDVTMLDKRIALDMATIAKVVPWLMMGLERSLDVHVMNALREVDSAHDKATRMTLIRGTIINMLYGFKQNPQPELVEAIAQEVVKQVDQLVAEKYDHGLGGEPA